MSLVNQARSLSLSGAEWRQSVQGTDAAGAAVVLDYDNAAQHPEGSFTLIRSQEQLDAMGCFKLSHDAVVRIIKTKLVGPPRLNKKIILPLADGSKLSVRIDEFGNNDISAEWVLGCKSI